MEGDGCVRGRGGAEEGLRVMCQMEAPEDAGGDAEIGGEDETEQNCSEASSSDESSTLNIAMMTVWGL